MVLMCLYTASAQQKKENKAVKTEILKGSEQQMTSECGVGKTSINQTVTTIATAGNKMPIYKIQTVLWLQMSDAEGYSCVGAWGYELMSITEEKKNNC